MGLALNKPNRRNDFELSQIAQLRHYLSLWICDVDFWIDEINLTQERLDECSKHVDEQHERKKVEQFQNQIIYYRDELLTEMKHDLLIHQKLLDGELDVTTLQKRQLMLQERMNGLELQMKARRKLLDEFIQTL